jgi:hypothetical protein
MKGPEEIIRKVSHGVSRKVSSDINDPKENMKGGPQL